MVCQLQPLTMESAVPISVHIMAGTYYVTLQGWTARRGIVCGELPNEQTLCQA